MSFATAINCMDGRVQQPVIDYLMNRFDVEYVDVITQPGPNLILSKNTDGLKVESMLQMVELSLEKHGSVGVAVVGHHDCAGNPAPRHEQESHIYESMEVVRNRFPDNQVVGLWVDENWSVIELEG